MKIAIALFDINNPGGIVNHTEQLAFGLRELGHEVDLISLEWKSKQSRAKRLPDHPANEPSFFGGRMHPYNGWDLRAENRIPYRGAQLVFAQKRLAEYDGIIWTVPCPRRRKDSEGNMDWVELYDASPRNVGVIHDGNLVGFYPNIVRVIDKFRNLAAVHPCALSTAKELGGTTHLIPNPMPSVEMNLYGTREVGWLSAQTFKGWKKVGDLVRAARYMSPDLVKILAGGGIEHCYMTSPDKCKPDYFHEDGTRIWDAALDNGMEFLGFIGNEERDRRLRGVTALVDPSYSRRYAEMGSHFNRVVIEAMIQGTIPVARTSVTEHAGWLESGRHYMGIPDDASPQEYAEIVEEACELPNFRFAEHWEALLQRFERVRVAEQYAELLFGPATTWSPSPDMVRRSDAIMQHFERTAK